MNYKKQNYLTGEPLNYFYVKFTNCYIRYIMTYNPNFELSCVSSKIQTSFNPLLHLQCTFSSKLRTQPLLCPRFAITHQNIWNSNAAFSTWQPVEIAPMLTLRKLTHGIDFMSSKIITTTNTQTEL